VGRRIKMRLLDHKIFTAWDLARASQPLLRAHFGVVLERTARELQGTPCLSLEHEPPPKQQIACTRSFGRPVSDLAPLVEAVSTFAQRAAEKLRAQDHRASAVHVFAHSSPFRDGPRFARSTTIQLPQPSSDTALLVRAAARGIAKIYEPGYQLAKAGVMLLELSPATVQQTSLLDEANDDARDHSPLMDAMDQLNARYGKGTIGMASALQESGWGMRQDRRTPCYTTELRDIPIART
jgi:DNA polymerase V